MLRTAAQIAAKPGDAARYYDRARTYLELIHKTENTLNLDYTGKK